MTGWIIATALAIPVAPSAQSGDCGKPFETALRGGGAIDMDLRAGEIRIQGTDKDVLRVTCEVGDKSERIQIAFFAGKLRIERGPSRDVHIHIEVPANMDLKLRATAGDVTVAGVTGSKDIGLRAGRLSIEAGKAGLYRHVHASVTTGDLKAPLFGAHKSGIMRTFSTEDPEGKYDLRASVTTGELEIK